MFSFYSSPTPPSSPPAATLSATEMLRQLEQASAEREQRRQIARDALFARLQSRGQRLTSDYETDLLMYGGYGHEAQVDKFGLPPGDTSRPIPPGESRYRGEATARRAGLIRTTENRPDRPGAQYLTNSHPVSATPAGNRSEIGTVANPSPNYKTH